jgi:hypothetical protein
MSIPATFGRPRPGGDFLTSLPVFASLTSLKLDITLIDRDTFASLLSPEKTPNLRTLEVHTLLDPVSRNTYTPPLASALLSRLERVCLSAEDYQSPYSPAPPPSDKILWRIDNLDDVPYLPRLTPRHIALSIPDLVKAPDAAVETLREVLLLLKPSTSLRRIILREDTCQSGPLPGTVQLALDEVFEAGRGCGVQVRLTEEEEFDDFGRYLRRKEEEASGSSGIRSR